METVDNTAILPPSVAPAATEPAAPVEAPATEALPKKDIWGEAAERLKAALAEQQATPAAETPSGEPQPHWQGQPRDEQGKWTAAQQAAAQAAAAAVQPTEGAEPAAEPAEPAIQIALPAVRDGQEPVVVEADDQETADTIRALINSHKREADTKRRMQAVEAREMEGRELETMLRTAPELLFDRMSAENQQRFIAYGLANHFEAFRPLVGAWMQDDVARRESALTLREQSSAAKQTFQREVSQARAALEIERAVHALIPWSASDEDAADFHATAMTRLARLAEAGQPIQSGSVATLVQRDLQRFGWLPDESGAAVNAAPSTPSLLATTPRAAVAAARPSAPPATGSTTDAERRAAAAVVPAGGAAAVTAQAPRVSSWSEASRLMRSLDPRGWKSDAT